METKVFKEYIDKRLTPKEISEIEFDSEKEIAQISEINGKSLGVGINDDPLKN